MVYQGQSALDPAVQRKLVDQVAQSGHKAPSLGENLTVREREVLQLLARGLTNQQIAGELSIEVGTVRYHVGNILRKLGLTNRTQAVVYAVEKGLAKPGKK